jgi:hypothetical protein
VEKALRQGGRDNGFWRERWNLPRLATVTQRAMEAHYSSRSFLVGLPCGKEQRFTASHPRSKDLADVNTPRAFGKSD